ncbi:MAG TPA: hypothetical protein DDZ80_19690, partial [Cyanobacteria bacterium UBA8803]|nr:hypothetical protein [Cyanobacteria bacterium UBA8803]
MKGSVSLFLTAGFIGTSAFIASSSFSAANAATLSINLAEYTGDDAGASILLDDGIQAGKVKFTVNVTSPTVGGDIRGLFFDIANNSLLGGLNITGNTDPFSNFTQIADGVTAAGTGNNINGGGAANPGPFDVGLAIGSAGSSGGLLQTTSFFLSHNTQSLDISQFFNQTFGLRLQATGGSNGSSKLKGTAPSSGTPTPTPTPTP